MDNGEIKSDTITENTINFIILGGSFYLSCFLLSIQVESNIIIQTFIYAYVVLLAVAIRKRILSANFTSEGKVVKTIIINATGLFIGASIMLIFGFIFPELGEFAAAVVLASVIAFFVFGTLYPLLRSDRHSVL